MPASTIVLTVRDDGTTTIQKVASEMRKFHDEAQTGAQGLTQAWNTMRGALGAVGIGVGVVELVSYLKEGLKSALDAEQAFNQLRFAVNAASEDGFGRYAAAVTGATERTAAYAHVTEHVAEHVLQLLVTNTGKLGSSLENVNLVFDLAIQKGIDYETAVKAVSAAIEGNSTGLKKFIPEFAEVIDELDKGASRSEKAAVFVDFLRDKVGGATAAMSEHAKSVADAHKHWDEFWKGLADKGLKAFDTFRNSVQAWDKEAKKTAETEDELTKVTREGDEALKHLAETKAKAALAADEHTKALVKEMAAEKERMAAQEASLALLIREKEFQEHATAALNARTEAEKSLKQAQDTLKKMDQDQAQAELLRGSPDDAFRRIKQGAFEGGAGTSIEGLQGLLKATQSVKGGDQGDQDRLLRDLNDLLRGRASEQQSTAQQTLASPASGSAPAGPSSPFGSGSQLIGGGPGGAFTFSPTIIIAGTEVKAVVRDVIKPHLDDLAAAAGEGGDS